MADAVANPDDGDQEVEVLPRKSGMSGKKLVLFILLPLLILGGAAAAMYFTGMLDKLLVSVEAGEKEGAQVEEVEVFYELPDMLVNLNSSGNGSNYLKLSISLELKNPAGLAELEKVQPRIIDSFQVYLRELRVDDLEGSSGMQRLREELLMRANTTVEEPEITDVLFRQILVQ
ncbi:flagellar basal body-associated FliL family protein [Fodinicurvata fenggangensis]|uniref:flagellar basal body-associated FliL family protein n=1 Tax=Fodinicurvata fenggangensis TaxID=1121830 RepID=UPI00047A9AF6|nr:flagellar basal body-associated FliL family protein [Fodinicurvata fenggangensis]